ncbi:MAG: Crp/Fnr family transcriptional regulator [Eubacteriales bacterium]
MVVKDILAGHFLFGGCSPTLIDRAAAGCSVACFDAGQVVSLPPDRPGMEEKVSDTPFLSIILRGTAAVYAPGEGSDCLLRVLHTGDTFGVANLFSPVRSVTRVVAVKPLRLLCMEQDTVRELLSADPSLAMRYIGFLSDRIRFLNRRLACLSAGSAPRRLAAWLDTTAPDDATGFSVPLPLSRLADALSLGRATLYRAFDELVEKGYVRREGKHILFLDRAGMRQDFGLL